MLTALIGVCPTVVDDYVTGLARDVAQLAELRATATKFKSWFTTH